MGRLTVVTPACLLYVMDLTVLHVAIPQITEDLHPTGTQLLWIIDGRCPAGCCRRGCHVVADGAPDVAADELCPC